MEIQIKCQVRNSFTKLRNAIDLREKLLLRQLEVTKFRKFSATEINFLTSNEEEILNDLRNYGSFQNIESFLPYLENENEEEENCKDIKFIKSDLTNINIDNKISESIINLTLKESQDIISKSDDLKMKTSDLVSQVQQKLKVILPLSKQNVQYAIDKTCTNDSKEMKSTKQNSLMDKDVKVKECESKLKRNSAGTTSKKKILKNINNLTLNNCCSGSIILKNISNLTINTCKKPDENDSKVCKNLKSCEIFYPSCDFYDKLITENEALKKNIVNQSVNCTTYQDPITAVCLSPKNVSKNDETFSINSVSNITSESSIIIDENDLPSNYTIIENLRRSKMDFTPESETEEIIPKTMHLPENFADTHSPIIQCWLNKMCLETEIENNNEILEFSNIVS